MHASLVISRSFRTLLVGPRLFLHKSHLDQGSGQSFLLLCVLRCRTCRSAMAAYVVLTAVSCRRAIVPGQRSQEQLRHQQPQVAQVLSGMLVLSNDPCPFSDKQSHEVQSVLL